tara:strand:+ start:1096 stop:1434 length:339 start_codon:yes stop_codon:yes gene_type:complete
LDGFEGDAGKRRSGYDLLEQEDITEFEQFEAMSALVDDCNYYKTIAECSVLDALFLPLHHFQCYAALLEKMQVCISFIYIDDAMYTKKAPQVGSNERLGSRVMTMGGRGNSL